jgi:polyisoprenyl-teichoic acid--peptidoglycan teichoic acid transferase
MSPSRRKVRWVLGGVLLAALALLALLIYPEAKRRWLTPLETGLSLPSLTPALSSEMDSTPVLSLTESGNVPQASATEAVNLTQTLADEALNATAIPASTPQPLCGGPPLMTVLAVGADNRADSYLYGLADVIRVVRVDFVTPKVTVFTLPRDLWVEIPGIEDHYGITHGKLNQAYFYGTPGMGYYDGPDGAAGLLARTLELNYGLRVDHYGVVNMETFKKIVDAVGGISVYLPSAVDGRPSADFPFDMGYFSVGKHNLNGEQALRLARIRHRHSDLVRAENQNRVICALKEKIATPAIFPKVPQLIGALRDSVLTDLTQQQLEQLACLVPQLKPEDLIFTGLPQEILSSGRIYSPELKDETFILDADPQVIQDYTGQFMSGSWPAEPEEPFCP